MSKFENIGLASMILFILLAIVANLAFWGVVVWAIIQLVQHITGG